MQGRGIEPALATTKQELLVDFVVSRAALVSMNTRVLLTVILSFAHLVGPLPARGETTFTTTARGGITTPTAITSTTVSVPPRAGGYVFYDADNNGRFDRETENGAAGIAVSDGGTIALTDQRGRWNLSLTTESRTLFITQPANHERRRVFYHIIDALTSPPAKVLHVDFPVRRAAKPDSETPRFIQTSDIHIHGEADRARFTAAIEEINQLTPPADFVTATGDLVETGNEMEQLAVYTDTTEVSRIPWFHIFGNHDQNSGEDRSRNYRAFMGPDYYSADYGNLHLVMLNSMQRTERQDRWLADDIRLLGKGKTILAFQHYAADEETLARLQSHGVRAVFTGHWHSNKITSHAGGLTSINHPTFIMGGIDGSPSSFRIINIRGTEMTSEFRFNEFGKRLHIVYPQEVLSGPEELLAEIYDTSGGVLGAQYSISVGAAKSGGPLKKQSPLLWSSTLSGSLPKDDQENFHVQVEATNHAGEKWATSATVARPTRANAAPTVQLNGDWPQFMGNAQRTGVATDELSPPLSLRWASPTGSYIDYSSPVLYKGRVAIGVKDRDNLGKNGVAVIDAASGKLERLLPTDAMVNHSPAFAANAKDEAGALYAAAAGGTVYCFNPATGATNLKRQLGEQQQRWIYAAPAVDGTTVVLGNSPMLLCLDARTNAEDWLSTFGKDWISSYSSPSFTPDKVIMGAYSLHKEGRPSSIYALNRQTGEPLWTNKTSGVHGSISIYGDRGYAIDIGGVYKVIDLTTGKDIVRRDLEKKRALGTPAVDDSIVIVPTGAGKLYAFDRETNEQKWVFQPGKSLWNLVPYDKDKLAVFSSPTISGNTVYIGCSDGKLYALDKQTGTVRWSYDFGVPVLSTPCISGNTLLTAAYDGTVYAFTGRH